MTSREDESGNPTANPPGVGAGRAMAGLLADDGEELVRRVIRRARAGDRAATQLCLERIMPRPRERPVPLALPRIETPGEARAAATDITAAIAAGMVTPREAAELLRVIEAMTRVLEAAAEAENAGKTVVHQTLFRWMTEEEVKQQEEEERMNNAGTGGSNWTGDSRVRTRRRQAHTGEF